jgi:secreted protein with Ig-like and vWFA domain
MKKTLLALGLATGLAVPLFAGETLHLNLVPDRDVLLKGRPQEVVVKIDLNAIADRQKHRRTPLNLAVVLDKSGSMTGAKLEKTKQAALQLVDRLAPNDVFSLVIFSDEARGLVPAQKVEDKEALKENIEGIEAGGSTALYAGVKTGARQLQKYFSSKRIHRVILLSDGLANVGPSSTRDLRRLGSDLAEPGISVTTIGVGDRSINAAVNAEKVLVLTAEAEDKAIAEADAGNYQQAAATLAAQNRVLNEAYANAPAAVQVQIRAETNNLDDFSSQLNGGSYDSVARKTLQLQSYNTRNSK